jgi:hypothetical protein
VSEDPTERREGDEPPYPQGPDDEHTEFVESAAESGDQDTPGAQTGLGAGATSEARDPDAPEDRDEAEAARPPRGAPAD